MVAMNTMGYATRSSNCIGRDTETLEHDREREPQDDTHVQPSSISRVDRWIDIAWW
jgi:hypothetical protein